MGGSLSGDVVDHHGHTDNDTHTEDEDDDDMCPICLIPLTRASRGKFCVGPCGHCICQADAERILLSATKHAPPVLSYYYGGGGGGQGGDESIDPYLYVPTLGRCPICRHGWSLFDLQHVNDKDDNSEAATTDNNEDGRDGRTTTTPPRRLVYVKNTDMTLWPVTGKTFADERRGGNGLALSFDLDQGPVVSWYKEPDNGMGMAEEGTEQQQQQVVVVHFEPGSHFHDRSRTFHGHVVLRDDDQSATWGGVSLLRCILQFSSDYRFIPLGVWMDDEDKVIQWLGVGRRMLHSVGLSSELGHARQRRQVRPTYHGSTVWGNTFCQSLKVGLASYHFLTTEEAYISYEHPVSSQWPPLDDGSPVPDRIFFRNTSYDAHERIFRGEICWEQDYGTTWQGFRTWMYQMKFDSNYTYIVSGTVHSLLVGTDEPHETSTFGHDLVYMNAAVDEYFTTLMMIPGTSNGDHQHNDEEQAEEQITDRFTRLSLPLRQQWASEGASVRLIAMLHSVLTKVIMRQESPVDFNLLLV